MANVAVKNCNCECASEAGDKTSGKLKGPLFYTVYYSNESIASKSTFIQPVKNKRLRLTDGFSLVA